MFALRRLIHDLLQLLQSTVFVECGSKHLNAVLQRPDVKYEVLIGGHDIDAILSVFSLLTLQLVMQSINRFLQELHLNFVLLLDVVVLDHDLLVMALNVAL